MKQAVCVLIEHPITGLVLCVSRGSDLENWGLPGGKVEDGEDLLDAALRELEEETGIHVHFWDRRAFIHVFEAVCYGAVSYNCHVFKVYNSDYVEHLTCEGSFTDSVEGKVEWRSWGDLIATTALFKDFNWELMMKLNKDENVSDS